MNDNQYITKTDLKAFGDGMEERLKKDNARYFGLISEHFDSKFETIMDAILGNTERLDRIEQRLDKNEDEHRDFCVRIGVLERT